MLPAPPIDGASAATLASFDTVGLIGIEALDLSTRPFEPGPFRGNAFGDLTEAELSLYPGTLEDLRLIAGPLLLDGGPQGHPLPPPARAYRATLLAGDWEEVAEVKTAEVQVRLLPVTCPNLTITELPLPEAYSGAGPVVPLDDTSAFVQLVTTPIRLRDDGRFEDVGAAIPLAGPAWAGAKAVDGTLWLADQQGNVVYGDLQAGLQRAPAPRWVPGAVFVELDAPTEGPFEVDLWVDNATTALVQRYDGRTWSTIYEGGPVLSPRGLRALGPDQLAIFGLDPAHLEVRLLRGGRVETYGVPFSDGDALGGLRVAGAYGLVAIGTIGSIYGWKEGTFTNLGSRLNTVADVAPAPHGLIYGGWRDNYGLLRYGEPCAPINQATNYLRARIVPLGSAYLLPVRAGPIPNQSIGLLRINP